MILASLNLNSLELMISNLTISKNERILSTYSLVSFGLGGVVSSGFSSGSSVYKGFLEMASKLELSLLTSYVTSSLPTT